MQVCIAMDVANVSNRHMLRNKPLTSHRSDKHASHTLGRTIAQSKQAHCPKSDDENDAQHSLRSDWYRVPGCGGQCVCVFVVDPAFNYCSIMSRKGDNMNDFWNRPCAVKGLTSYRYRNTFGWVMIGATDDANALNEANRSIKPDIADISKLQVWNGQSYVNVT